MGAEQSQPLHSADGTAQNGPIVPEDHGQFVLVVSAPPGVGKEGLMGRLISESNGRVGYCAKVGSVTANEKGLLYFFESTDDETARPSCEDSYPTIRQAIQAVLNDGKSCVADVDVAGVRALRKANVPGCYVFIVPPTLDAMRATLRKMFEKREDGEAKAAEMFKFAESEIASLREQDLFDYAVVNESEDKAIAELQQCVAKGSVVARRSETGHSSSGVLEPPGVSAPSSNISGSEPTASVALDRAPVPDKAVPSTLAAGESGSTDPKEAEALIVLHPGMARWEGKVALVTGASSGIGWAVCEALALAGMRVVACARRQERLEALQRHVLRHGINGQMFLPVVCDITKEAEVQALNKLVARQFNDRHISVLVNNAGVAKSNASLMDGDSAAWIQMVSTNVLGVAMCCREVCRGMKAANSWGHIINISSLSGHRVPQGIGSGGFYAGTKHAVRAMTEGLRQEARAAGVPLKVSEISPGVVHTNFFATMSDGDEKLMERYLKTPGLSAYDIANTVLYMLATPEHMEINDVLVRPTQQLV